MAIQNSIGIVTVTAFILWGGDMDLWKRVLLLCIAYVVLLACFYRDCEREQREGRWIRAFCLLLAFDCVLGKSLSDTQSWSQIFGGVWQLLRSCLFIVGWYRIFRCAVRMIRQMLQLPLFQNREPRSKIAKFLFEKNAFWRYFAVILILELTWFLAYRPGTIEPDAYRQLMEGLGVRELSTHHPVLISKGMAGCVVLARYAGLGDNFGIFLYTSVQFCIQAIAFSYLQQVLGKLGTPIFLRFATLLFQAVLPLFPMWGFTFVKDTGYCIFVTILTTLLADLAGCKESKTVRRMIVMAVACAGCVLFRNDGRYVVVITMLFGILFGKKLRRYFVVGLLTAAVAIGIVDGVYVPSLQAAPGSVREMLSIPLQQTARYVKLHGDDITVEEKAVLEEVFGGDYTIIAQTYDVNISDPVKTYFVEYPSKELLNQYFKVWAAQFLRHPDTYVQAFLNHAYGYTYPWKKFTYPTTDHFGFLEGIAWFRQVSGDGIVNDDLNTSFWMHNPALRNVLESGTKLLARMPVTRLLFTPAVYCVGLFGVVFLLLERKKYRDCIICIPLLVVWLICVASPVVASVRYALPIMACSPILAGMCMRPGEGKAGNTNTVDSDTRCST